MCQALFPHPAGCCSSWYLTNRHITSPGCYCLWCAAPRHYLPLFTVPQSVMCHVIRVYTFCPSWVCRDPEGKKGECVFVGGWHENEAARLLNVPGRQMGCGHPPDVPRCSWTSCGQSCWQARETQSHIVINHHTRCSMRLGCRRHPAEYLSKYCKASPST